MRNKIAIYILLLLMLLPASAAAEPESVSELLKLYNISGYDPEEEGRKLYLLEEEYRDIAHRVNTNTMLEAAMELYDERRKAILTRIDSDTYELSNRLEDLEHQMKASKEDTVEAIMQLDGEYRSVLRQLKKNQDEREQLLVPKEGVVSTLSLEDAKRERNRLESLSPKLEKQKQTYEQALSCPAIGEISTFRSPLEIPVQMTSPYGERLDPITLDSITFHHGMDLYAPEGTTVLSAFNGVVEEASSTDELGNYVVVNHGCGVKTLYGHLESYHVEVGQEVFQYASIARSGNTGSRTTGPHLHFGVYINGKSVDPGRFVPY
ncbi:hypothetical protein D3P09_16755 [Paenibacillus pinisoli]|uniref:M23ase beta-sheet core domain-containing protein n=1 Tax=Paenibacillus pinisoli TaxID=1276110 RepID=A0A3A6PCK9_9BACL|nr:M23 family metallopeptidase [Paenibacillus pinisoli]RJX39142.1 hypothetical protein D3P09_16755 [Paenibacillus pinisoli]